MNEIVLIGWALIIIAGALVVPYAWQKQYDRGVNRGWAEGYKVGMRVRALKDKRERQRTNGHLWKEEPLNTTPKWSTYACADPGCPERRTVPTGTQP